MTTKQAISENRRLWLAAIKPPMYSVAIVPISLGTAIAFAETGQFNSPVCFTFLGSALLIIGWLNLTNDVFDSDTGIDVNKAHSIVNLTGNRSLVFWVANICLGIGVLGIMLLSWWQQDWTILVLILLCCFLGYTYQGPPFRLGYLGLGEVICFFTFGPGAVSAAYYAQVKQFSFSSIAISSVVGLSTALILWCSHFHQVEDDLAAGKKSPIVRLGTAKGAIVLTWGIAGIYILTILLILSGCLSPWGLLILGSIPFAYQLARYVQQNHDLPQKVCNSKFVAINLYLASSLLLTIGLVLSTYV